MKKTFFYEPPKAEVINVLNENSILSSSPYNNLFFEGSDAFDGGVF
jgi:hypothetical protein